MCLVHEHSYFDPPGIVKPEFPEMTAQGVAIAAGLACGVWQNLSQLPRSPCMTFEPTNTQQGMYSTDSYKNLHIVFQSVIVAMAAGKRQSSGADIGRRDTGNMSNTTTELNC